MILSSSAAMTLFLLDKVFPSGKDVSDGVVALDPGLEALVEGAIFLTPPRGNVVIKGRRAL